MIVVSASMPRSGSLWYYRLTQDVLTYAAIRNYIRSVDLRGIWGQNIGGSLHRFDWGQLFQLEKATKDGLITVKTHKAPSHVLRYFIGRGKVKATYIYRDPRDVIISALERGNSMREKGEAKRYFGIGPYRTFARIKTLRGAILWVRWQLFPRWQKWQKCHNVLFVKYEDLVRDTSYQLKRLTDFFEIDLSDIQLEEIVKKYQPDGSDKLDCYWRWGGGKMFNKGVIGRYKTVLSKKEQDLCLKCLEKILSTTGYFDT